MEFVVWIMSAVVVAGVLCLLPIFWPYLIGRHFLSKHSAQPTMAEAIHRLRRRWAEDLKGTDISFDGIPDETGNDRT